MKGMRDSLNGRRSPALAVVKIMMMMRGQIPRRSRLERGRRGRSGRVGSGW